MGIFDGIEDALTQDEGERAAAALKAADRAEANAAVVAAEKQVDIDRGQKAADDARAKADELAAKAAQEPAKAGGGVFGAIKDALTTDDADRAAAARKVAEQAQAAADTTKNTAQVEIDAARRAAADARAKSDALNHIAPAAATEAASVEAAPVEVAPVEVAPVEVAPVEVAPVEVAPVAVEPAPRSAPTNALAVDGEFGPRTIAATQRWVGAKDDGAWGPASKRALQAKLGVTIDGQVGVGTIKALQSLVGAKVDGAWGPQTTSKLQEFLNTL